MDSFGEYIRRERELRGVTLEEIAKTSNISVTNLKALESDDFESLHAEVFVKGFLRCYAESIGLDHNEILLAYNSFIATKRDTLKTSERPIKKTSNLNINWASFLVIVTFVVVSSLMVYYYVKKSREVKPSSASEEKFPQEVDKIGIEESKRDKNIVLSSKATEQEILFQAVDKEVQPQEEGISDNLVPPPPVEPEKTSEKKEVVDLLTLSMEAKEAAWISLIIDDADIKEALLVPGETARWKAKEKFVVSLGNATGTRLKLNKKYITLPKTSSNIIRNFTITLDNIKPQ